MPTQEKCRILDHQKVGPRHYQLTLVSQYISSHAAPGQFVQVKCSDSNDPLLRRPISFHQINPEHDTFSLLYEVVGKGSELLTKYFVGEELDVLGPLGTGFTIEPAKKVHILVGGGMGVAPLSALAETLKGPGTRGQVPGKNAIYILLGAKNKECVQCEGELKEAADQVVVSTDHGKKGLISDILLDLLDNTLAPGTWPLATIYACGPRPMLKAIAAIAAQKQIDCQLSMEERLACGIGACKGCAVKTISGYKMVCKDGPVFDSREVVFT